MSLHSARRPLTTAPHLRRLLPGLGLVALFAVAACGGDDTAATGTTDMTGSAGSDTTDTVGTAGMGGSGGAAGSGSSGSAGKGGTGGTKSDAGKDAGADARDSSKADAKADGGPGMDASMDSGPDTRAEAAPEAAAAVCGNGTIEGNEKCDNGTANDTCAPTSDGGLKCNNCSSICTDNTACLTCMNEQCPESIDLCSGVDGVASDGPGMGQDRVVLCNKVYKCILQSGCAIRPEGSETLSCYCGDKAADACGMTGMANGPCKAEIQAAMETFDATEVINHYTDILVAGGAALQKSLCEVLACRDTCYYGRVVPALPSDGGPDAGGADTGSD